MTTAHERIDIEPASDEYAASMTDAYIAAALFTADEAIIEQHSGNFDPAPHLHRVTKAMRAEAHRVCADFAKANAADLLTYSPGDCGHDLWLTRNGHGAGFWEADHCTDDEGERLTVAAKRLGGRSVVQVRGVWLHFDI